MVVYFAFGHGVFGLPTVSVAASAAGQPAAAGNSRSPMMLMRCSVIGLVLRSSSLELTRPGAG